MLRKLNSRLNRARLVDALRAAQVGSARAGGRDAVYCATSTDIGLCAAELPGGMLARARNTTIQGAIQPHWGRMGCHC